MKIKNEFKNKVISRRVNGKLLTFDINNTKEKDYIFFKDNGFSDVFEGEVQKELVKKIIEFTNEVETPIIKKKKL